MPFAANVNATARLAHSSVTRGAGASAAEEFTTPSLPDPLGRLRHDGPVPPPTTDDWDSYAETFDAEPDHGLENPRVRAAWADLVLPQLPAVPATVADIGCGTGTLSVLLALSGYEVRGLDTSPRMLEAARRKAAGAGVEVAFEQADAADPPYSAASLDAVVVRHVLWALPDPGAAVERWAALLRPGGVLLLIEGCWSTGSGLSAAECERLALGHLDSVTVRRLEDPTLWGRPVDDERFLLRALARDVR
jgi:SAM-dependent methyltransferase